MKKTNNNYDYVYWNNTYEGKWYAIPTNEYLLFFNGSRSKTKGVKSSSDLKKLLAIVNKD